MDAGPTPTAGEALRLRWGDIRARTILAERRTVHYVAKRLGHATPMTKHTCGHVIDELKDELRGDREKETSPRERRAVRSLGLPSRTTSQSVRQGSVEWPDAPRADAGCPPRPRRSQRRVDACEDLRGLGIARDEDRPEPRRPPAGVDCVVVRPPAGTVVLPVPAQLARHRGADRRWIAAWTQGDLRSQNVCANSLHRHPRASGNGGPRSYLSAPTGQALRGMGGARLERATSCL